MSYNLYNIKNIISQIYKLNVSKLELEIFEKEKNNGNNITHDIYYIGNYYNIIKNYYEFVQDKISHYFSIRLNFNNIFISYDAFSLDSKYRIILDKSDKLEISKQNNTLVSLLKNYDNKKIFTYNYTLQLVNKKIIYQNIEYIYNYINNTIYTKYTYKFFSIEKK